MKSKLASGLAILLIAAWWTPTAWSQDDEVDLGEVIEAKIDELDEASKEGPVADILTELIELYKKSDEKRDKQDIAKAIAETMGSRNQDVRLAAAGALADLGEDGAKMLRAGLRKVRKDPELAIKVVESMGKNGDLSLMPELMKLLNDKEFVIIKTAAASLGAYEGSKIPYRIKIVDAILKVYTSTENQVNSDPRNNVAREKLNMIQVDMNSTLAKLTGQSLGSADAYRQWFGEAKKNPRAWPKEKEDGDS
ncbi:MAG: hypothetical protein RL885_32805 [Planctomycetota bacterium]